jgi:hypothetical protein
VNDRRRRADDQRMIPAVGIATASVRDLLARFDRSAARVAGAQPDYVRETVEQVGVQYGVEANVAVIKTADQMVGTLFDVVA